MECISFALIFQIFLWTDEHSLEKLKTENLFKLKDIREVDFYNADIIHNESFVAKSDLMRYEVYFLLARSGSAYPCHILVQIIYQNGGIYLDTDSVSVIKFPPIFQKSFVSHSLGYRDLQNSVFGKEQKLIQ